MKLVQLVANCFFMMYYFLDEPIFTNLKNLMIHWIQQEFQIIRSGLDKEDPMIHGSCPVSKG